MSAASVLPPKLTALLAEERKAVSKLFISHATADRDFVEQHLVRLLRALGFDVWFAPDDITTSNQWERSILAGLASSEWFVLVMSAQLHGIRMGQGVGTRLGNGKPD